MILRLATITLLLAAAAATASAQTLDDLIAKNYAARGHDKLKLVQSLRISGRMSSMEMGVAEAPLVLVQKRPSLTRMDVNFKGMTVVAAYDGTTAWQIMPFFGSDEPQKLSGRDTM